MAKHKAKKQTKGKPLKRGFPWFLWLAIGVGIVGIVIFAFVRTSPASEPASSNHSDELKAAIIDQLYSLQPNPGFIERTTEQLKDYGFKKVDVYQGDDVTVDFYRKLPTYGYRLIIFRVHSGLLIGRQSVANQTWLFTSEPYSRMRYFFQQMRGQVTHATTNLGTPLVFAVGAKFITQGLEKFTNTAIIMMGCAALESEDLAQAFIRKGASTYMAWDATVGLNYVDDATATLMEKLFLEELTIANAVAETMEEKGPDPNNKAVLKYYPPASANKTIRQLIE